MGKRDKIKNNVQDRKLNKIITKIVDKQKMDKQKMGRSSYAQICLASIRQPPAVVIAPASRPASHRLGRRQFSVKV